MQHPDEGTIHAWLDGELSEDQANEISAHLAECPECSAKVAEARGLIAASTRILTALDDVPAGVIPEVAVTPSVPPTARRRRWYDRTDIRAAATVLVVAGASYLVVKRDSGASRSTLMVEAAKIESAPMSTENAPVTPPRVAQPSVKKPPPVPPHEIAKAIAGTAVPEGMKRSPASQTLDAVAAAPPDTTTHNAESRLLLMPKPASGRVTVTSKRGSVRDSTTFSAGVAGGVASGLAASTPVIVARALGVVEGRVVDKRNNQGLAGTSVMLGSALGAFTDKDGRFSIANVPVGEQHLRVRRIGYLAQNISLVVPQDSSVITNVAMEQQALALLQVVTADAKETISPSTLPRVISVDSATGRHRTIYEISPGVRVTLVDTLEDVAKEKVTFGQLNARVAGVAPRAANEADEKTSMHVISWTAQGHRYELSGPVPVQTLQALQQRLMEMKR